MFYLGVDAGTTCIKAAIVSEQGIYIDMVTEDIPLIKPSEDACELDMVKLWEILCRLLNTLSKNNQGIWGEVAGIGITGQGDGLWSIDQDGNPVRNAILWNDTRTKHLKIKNKDEIDGICMRNKANPLYAGSNIHILRWMLEHEPSNVKRIHKIFHCKDWLNFKLTGEICSDYTDMTTALMDLSRKNFSQEILDALGLSNTMDLFAIPKNSTDIIGYVTKEAAEQTGLTKGLPVIAGAIDVSAVAVGLGAVQTGDTCIIAGTTLANQTIIEESAIDFNKGLILSHVPKDQFICIMPTLSGAAAIDWVKKLFYPDESYEEIERIVNQVPLGSRGILFHPYLQGERAPFRNSFASGSFFGIRSTHRKEDFIRAAFEGIAMSLCDCFASLPQTNDRVFISGGASKNDTFCQMAADSLGKTIVRGQGKETGIKGIVSVLKVALGHEKEFAPKECSVDKEFFSDAERHEKYQGMFQLFQSLRFDYEKHWLQRSNLFDTF